MADAPESNPVDDTTSTSSSSGGDPQKENFSQQQAKINELKELVRQSEATQGKRTASAQEKAKNIAQRLTHLKSAKQSRSKQQLQQHGEQSITEHHEVSHTSTSSSLSFSHSNVTTETEDERPDHPGEEELTSQQHHSHFSQHRSHHHQSTMSRAESLPASGGSAHRGSISGSSGHLPETPGSEKIQLLRRQMEQNRARMAEREHSKRDVEQLVTQLKAKFHSSQMSLNSSAQNLGRSIGDLSLDHAGTAHEMLGRQERGSGQQQQQRQLHRTGSVRHAGFQSSADLSFGGGGGGSAAPQNFDRERIRYLERRCAELETQSEAREAEFQRRNVAAEVVEKQRQQEAEIIDLREQLREKDSLIEARTQAVGVMSDLGRGVEDELLETRSEWQQTQQQFAEVEEALRGRIASLEEANGILERARFELTVQRAQQQQEGDQSGETTTTSAADFATKLNELQRLNEKLQQRCCDFEVAEATLTAQIVDLRAEIERLQTPTNTENESDNFAAEIASLRSANAQLEAESTVKITELRAEIERLQQPTESERTNDIDLTAELASLRSAYAQLEADSTIQIAELRAQIERLQTAQDSTEDSVDLTAELASLRSANAQLDADLQERLTEAQVLAAQCAVLQQKLAAAAPRSLFSGGLDEPSGDSSVKETTSDSPDLARLRQQLDDANKAAIKQKLKQRQLQKQLDTLRKADETARRLGELSDANATLTARVRELEELANETGPTSTSASLAETCHNQIEANRLLEEQKCELIERLTETRRELDELRSQADSRADAQVTGHMDAIEQEERLASARSDIERLRRELAAGAAERAALADKLRRQVAENVRLLERWDKTNSGSSAESIEIVEALTASERDEMERIERGGAGEVEEKAVAEEEVEQQSISLTLSTQGTEANQDELDADALMQLRLMDMLDQWEKPHIEKSDDVPELTEKTAGDSDMSQDLSDSLTQLRHESAELQQRIETFTAERREVLAKLELLQSENARLDAQVSELQAARDQLTAERTEACAQAEELRRTVATLQTNKRGLRDLVNETTHLQQVVAAPLDTAPAEEVQFSPEEYEKSVLALTALLEGYRRGKDKNAKFDVSKKLAKEAKQTADLVQRLLAEHGSLVARMNEVLVQREPLAKEAGRSVQLEKELADACVSIRNVTAEHAEVTGRLAAAEKRAEEMADRLRSVEQEREILQRLVGEQKDQLIDTITEFQQKVDEQEAEIGRLQEQPGSAAMDDGQAAELGAKMLALKQLFDENNEQLEQQSAELAQQRETISALNGQLQEVYAQLADATAQLAAKDDELAYVQEISDAGKETEKKLSEKLRISEQAVHRVEQDLEEARKQVRAAVDRKPDGGDLRQLLAEAEQRNHEQLEKLKKFAANLKKKNAQCAELLEQVARLEAEPKQPPAEDRSEAEQKLAAAEEQLREKTTQIAGLSTEMLRLQGRLNATEADPNIVQDLRDRLHESRRAMEEMREHMIEPNRMASNINIVDLENMRKRLEQALLELEEVRHQLAQSTERVELLTADAAQVPDLLDRICEKNQQNKELRRELEDLSGQVEELRTQADEVTGLRASLAQRDQQTKELREELAQIQSEAASKETKMTQLQEGLEQRIRDLDSQLDELRQTLSTQSAELAEIQSEAASKEYQIIQLQSDSEQRIRALDAQIDADRQTIATQSAELQSVGLQLAAQTTDAQEQRVKIEKCKQILREKNRELKRLQAELTAAAEAQSAPVPAQDESEQLRLKLAEHEHYIEQLTGDKERLDERNAQLEQRCGEAEEAARLRASEAEEQFRLASANADRLAKETEKLVEERQAAERNLQAAQKKLAELEQLLGDSEAERLEVRRGVSEASERAGELARRLAAVEEELEALVEEKQRRETEMALVQEEVRKVRAECAGQLAAKHAEIDQMENELSAQLQVAEAARRAAVEEGDRQRDANAELQSEIVRLTDSLATFEQTAAEHERDAGWLRLQNDSLMHDQHDAQDLRMQAVHDRTEIENLQQQAAQLQAAHDAEVATLRAQLAELDSLRTQIGQNQTDDQMCIQHENERLQARLGALEAELAELQQQQQRAAGVQIGGTAALFAGPPMAFPIATTTTTTSSATPPQLAPDTERLHAEIEALRSRLERAQHDANAQLQHTSNLTDELQAARAEHAGEVERLRQLSVELAAVQPRIDAAQAERAESDEQLRQLREEVTYLRDAQAERFNVMGQSAESEEQLRKLREEVTLLRASAAYPDRTIDGQADEREELHRLRIEVAEWRASSIPAAAEPVIEQRIAATVRSEVQQQAPEAPQPSAGPVVAHLEQYINDLQIQLRIATSDCEQLAHTQQGMEQEILQRSAGYEQQIQALRAQLQQQQQQPEPEPIPASLLSAIEQQIIPQASSSNAAAGPVASFDGAMFFGHTTEHSAFDLGASTSAAAASAAVCEPPIVPKTTYQCHVEGSDEADEDDGWGFGSDEAALEEQHQAEQQQSATVPAPSAELAAQLSAVERELAEVQEELGAVRGENAALQQKSAKMMKKLKEYKARNDELAQRMSRESSTVSGGSSGGSSDLDAAIQEELNVQIRALEARLKEMRTEQEREQLERQGLVKRCDMLTAANERMTEMKERQDADMEVCRRQQRQLQRQLEEMQEWGDEGEKKAEDRGAESGEKVEVTAASEQAERKCAQCAELQTEIAELQACLDAEKEQTAALEARLSKLSASLAAATDAAATTTSAAVADATAPLRTENAQLQQRLTDSLATIDQLATDATAIRHQLDQMRADHTAKCTENRTLDERLVGMAAQLGAMKQQIDSNSSERDDHPNAAQLASLQQRCADLAELAQQRDAELLHASAALAEAQQAAQQASLAAEAQTARQVAEVRTAMQARIDELQQRLQSEAESRPETVVAPVAPVDGGQMAAQIAELEADRQHMEQELAVLNEHAMRAMELEDDVRSMRYELETKAIENTELKASIARMVAAQQEQEQQQQQQKPVEASPPPPPPAIDVARLTADVEARLNAHWALQLEQQCAELADSWRAHMAAREDEFAAQLARHSSSESAQTQTTPKREPSPLTAPGAIGQAPISAESSTDVVAGMQRALETQELEIVTLKEQLAVRSAEYARLVGQTQVPAGRQMSPPAAPARPKPSAKSELDLALYVLHQRDMRCEEMTEELMAMLEERDQLQLKLAGAMRQLERVRVAGGGGGAAEGEGCAAQIDTTDIATVPPTQSTSIEQSPPRQKTLRDEREQRHRQMAILQRDVATLPAEAVAELMAGTEFDAAAVERQRQLLPGADGGGASSATDAAEESPYAALMNLFWGPRAPDS